MSEQTLTFEQSGPIFRKLEGLPIVLVGGQALNCWCELYHLDEPGLTATLATSKDVDFQSDSDGLYQSANRLGTSPVTTDRDKGRQFLGYVTFNVGSGEVKIDFLVFPTGLTASAVDKLALLVPLASGAEVRVMHPIHCMVSRFANLHEAPEKYGTDHALGQLQASILCVRAYLRARVSAGGMRGALDDAESIFTFCEGKEALSAYKTRQIDPLDAIPDGVLSPAFYTSRLPRVRAALAALRSRCYPDRRERAG